jgi:hypothetical protein
MRSPWPTTLLLTWLGCQPPAPPPPVVALPPPRSSPSASATSATPPPAPPPPGVIPKELLAEMTSPAFRVSPPLAEAEACARKLHKRGGAQTGCAPEAPTILGFHAADDRIALLDRDAEAYIDPCPEIQAVLTTLDGTLVSRSTLLPRRPEAQCLNGPQKPWAPSEWAAKLHKAGYTASVNLVKKVAVAAHGAWAYYPVARLGAPLEGQMIYAHHAPGTDRLTVEMVSPSNLAHDVIASLALTPKCLVHDDKGGCAEKGAYDFPSIREVASIPGRDRLVVVIHLNSGEGHDTDKLFWIGNVPLPARIKPG